MDIVRKTVLEEINTGKPSCIASTRYVARECGWLKGIALDKLQPRIIKANKILNLCCTLGMLKKTENVKTAAGITPRYKIVLASKEVVVNHWKKCLEEGITSYTNVTKGTISAVVGEKEAANICRRER